MKLLLRLVSTDIHNKEVSLSATEFNTLRVLFRVQGSDGRSLDTVDRPKSAASNKQSFGKQLSNYAPFFNQPNLAGAGASNPSSTKVHMNSICDWINSLLFMIEPSENIYKMNSLNKCVTVKTYDEI